MKEKEKRKYSLLILMGKDATAAAAAAEGVHLPRRPVQMSEQTAKQKCIQQTSTKKAERQTWDEKKREKLICNLI